MKVRKALVPFVLGGALMALAACAPTQSSAAHGSRVKWYASTAALAKDSVAIVAGTVSAQRVASDVDPTTPFTISTVEVDGGSKGLKPGSVVEVRQLGSAATAGPAPLLEVGHRYLLFLTPSGLDGSLSSQYYVTGGDAGIYTGSAGTGRGMGTFAKVQQEDEDTLPSTLTLSSAAG